MKVLKEQDKIKFKQVSFELFRFNVGLTVTLWLYL